MASSKRSSVLLSILCILTVPSLVHSQHPSCKRESNSATLRCEEGGYILPTNFNANDYAAHESWITSLSIGGAGNVGLDDLDPLPRLPKLTQLELNQFNQDGVSEVPFPFSLFVLNNKPHLQVLLLSNVKLLKLTAADMSGFSNLWYLHISEAGLQSIAIDAFHHLDRMPSNAILPNYKPKMQYLEITGNADLIGLDWDFLAPIDESLTYLRMQRNGLQSDKVVKTGYLRLSALKSVDFSANNLTTLPMAVLETLPELLVADSKLTGSFVDNRFCAENNAGDCSCCELAEFGEWVRKNNMVNEKVQFTCGSGNAQSPVTLSVISDSNLHKHCKKQEPQPAPETLRATCVKGEIGIPPIDLDLQESRRFELMSDRSRKCGDLAYGLHIWLLKKAGLKCPARRMKMEESGIVVNCRAAGLLTLNDSDPDEVESSNVIFDSANTKKCRDIYFEFLEHFLGLEFE